MSSSYCINERGVFILLGGPSGVGKTTTINTLLSRRPGEFRRPISFTTRSRRPNEDFSEYAFISRDEILSLDSAGHLANLDEVHGELYGISRESIGSALAAGNSLIKEIHPANFHKLADDYPTVVTTVIDSVDPSNANSWLKSDWFTYASASDIFLNRAGMTPEQAATWLLRCLRSHLLFSELFPSIHDAEAQCKDGYDALAPEFYDEIRPTTAAFHRASSESFADLTSRIEKANPILELAPGNGWLRSVLELPSASVYSVDISHNMKPANGDRHLITPARLLPFPQGFFNTVVCSLADPILVPQNILEVARVLRPGGQFIFSVPTSTWSQNLRNQSRADKTEFILKDGVRIVVPSITRTIESLAPVFHLSGLRVNQVRFCFPDDSPIYRIPTITDPASSLGVPTELLPLVSVISVDRLSEGL